jgi:hypothetical protein
MILNKKMSWEKPNSDNPLRARLVEVAGLYPYSSAYRSDKGKANLSG